MNEQRQQEQQETGLTAPSSNGRQETDALSAIASQTSNFVGVAACNFPADPMKRYALVSLATDGDCQSVSDNVGKEIELKYWFTHSIQLLDNKTGELQTVPRCVLIDKDGNAFSASSDGVFRALSTLISSFGDGDLPEGLKVKFAQRKTRSGFSILTFTPVL